MIATILGILLSGQGKVEGDIPPAARTLTFAALPRGSDGTINVRDMANPNNKISAAVDTRINFGYQIFVGTNSFADIRLDHIGFARIKPGSGADGRPVGTALTYVTALDRSARDWFATKPKNPWMLQLTAVRGKIITRRAQNYLDEFLGKPRLQMNGDGVNTVGQGTAWSLECQPKKKTDSTDDVYTVLVGRHDVDVATWSPTLARPDDPDDQQEWQFLLGQQTQKSAPLTQTTTKPTSVSELHKLQIIGNPTLGPFRVVGPKKIDDSDWPDIVEMVNLGMLRIATLNLPPALSLDFHASGMTVRRENLEDLFAPGEAIRQRFSRFDFKDLEEALAGLKMRDEPNNAAEVRQIIVENQRKPADLLGQMQLISQIELISVEFKDSVVENVPRRERHHQQANVILDLTISDVFGVRLQNVHIDMDADSKSPSAVSAEQSLRSSTGALNRAVFRAVAEAYWRATADEFGLHWRGRVASWSGNSQKGTGTVNVLRKAGLYKGQRLKVLRMMVVDRPDTTYVGTVEVTQVSDTSIDIKAVNTAGQREVVAVREFKAGDIVEEDDIGGVR
jgi:hypothetical protein